MPREDLFLYVIRKEKLTDVNHLKDSARFVKVNWNFSLGCLLTEAEGVNV